MSKSVTPSEVKLAFVINKSKAASLVPSTFAHDILLIFNTLSEDTVNKVVVVVAVKLNPTDSPLMDVTDTIFGFAIIYSFYPKTIAIAIAFPVVAGEESKVSVPTPVVPDPETLSTFKNVPAVIFPVGNFIS